jgi:AAHS family 4-hydroxybenzoate transporter-like MFS transporter
VSSQSLEQLIDDHGLSRFQTLTILICTVVCLLDGFDTQCVAFVAPVIARDWGFSAASFGPVFAAGLAGGLVGAATLGRVADRIGRRPVLLLAMGVIAIGSLITPMSASLGELIACRVITGFGLGAALPAIIALTSEYAPQRWRTSAVTAMFCSFPLGAVLGALAGGPLIAHQGWQAVFLVGGALPLLMLPLIAVCMPESLAWLAARGDVDRTTRIVERLGRRALWNGELTTGSKPEPQRESLFELMADGRGPVTLLLGTAFFVSLLLVYLLVNWLPTLAVTAGKTVAQGALTSAALNLSGIVGSLIIAPIGDRKGPHVTIALAYGLGALLILVLAGVTDVGRSVFLFSTLAGLFCVGAQMCLLALATVTYPVELRGSSVGLLMAVGRLGAIVGPIVGGLLIGGEQPGLHLAWVVAGASVLAGAAIWAARNRPRAAIVGAALDQAS